MTLDNFLSFLQQILTMLDDENPYSIALAFNALNNIVVLAEHSYKTDGLTLRSMYAARRQFEYLVKYRNEFMGEPGEYQMNQIKRQRLAHVIVPSC